MFICAFTAWVRGPSILYTFIFKGAMRSSSESLLPLGDPSSSLNSSCGIWSQSTTAGQISIRVQQVPSMWCPNGHTSIYEPWEWLVWAIDSSQPTMVVGRLDQMSSHVATFWVLSLAFWIKVFGDGHHSLLSPCCYTTCMWTVPTCNRQNLGAIPSSLDAQKHLDVLFHSAGKASPLLSGWELSYNHSQATRTFHT